MHWCTHFIQVLLYQEEIHRKHCTEVQVVIETRETWPQPFAKIEPALKSCSLTPTHTL